MDDEWLDRIMPLRLAGEEQPRVVSRAAALRILGADAIDYRCRSGRWSRLAPAVYLMTPPAAPWDRLHAAFLHAGPASVISGWRPCPGGPHDLRRNREIRRTRDPTT